jgi:hypothetical protein
MKVRNFKAPFHIVNNGSNGEFFFLILVFAISSPPLPGPQTRESVTKY